MNFTELIDLNAVQSGTYPVCAALLDGIGTAGMSGCPVSSNAMNAHFLAGIYTGSIFPDHVIAQNNAVTALGKMCHLAFFLRGD
jgi:hypothetical protein